MRDLLTIIISEKRTLLRGLLVSFLFVFPFTFLPIISDGLTWESIVRRSPLSAVYAFGFSLIIVIAAVGHNYNNLVHRKSHFDKPAFTILNFYGRLDGVGSIVKELETFLFGKVRQFYFRLNLIETDDKLLKIEIVPLIDLNENEQLRSRLEYELGFDQTIFFGLTIQAAEKDLQNERFLIDKLVKLEATFIELGVKPLEIDETFLND